MDRSCLAPWKKTAGTIIWTNDTICIIRTSLVSFSTIALDIYHPTPWHRRNPKLTYTFACFHFFPNGWDEEFLSKKLRSIRITLVSWHFGNVHPELVDQNVTVTIQKNIAVFHRLPAITSMRFLEQSTIATQLVVLMPCRPPLRPRVLFFHHLSVSETLMFVSSPKKRVGTTIRIFNKSNSTNKKVVKQKKNNWETKKKHQIFNNPIPTSNSPFVKM